MSDVAALEAELAAALAARTRLRDRPPAATAAALAAAAARWRDDATLARELPAAIHLGDEMIRAVLPLAAAAIDEGALARLHAAEAGARGPALVAHVLASNVPALALPAIALGCLAGAAVLVKSGRNDRLSAPAFRRALAAVDPELAATVVTAYWPGGSVALEDRLLARADVVVASGGDAATAALARRLGARVVAHGARTSVAVVADDVGDAALAGLARDVALYEQRGCLSPQAVLVLGEAASVAGRLAAALDAVAAELPPVADTTAARAGRRLAIEGERFAGATVLEGCGGAVVVAPSPSPGEPIGGRTVRLHAFRSPAAIVEALAPGTVECVGTGGVDLDAEALRRRGVARVCAVGRMQRPRIDWPRGGRPALGVLFGDASPRIQVEP